MTYLRDFVRYAIPTFVGFIGGSLLLEGDYPNAILTCVVGIFLSLLIEPLLGRGDDELG